MFVQVSSSSDFVDKWNSEVVTTTESITPDSDSNSRKCAATASLDSSAIPSTSDDSISHPPATKKRCNYVNQGLDERIERGRKGKRFDNIAEYEIMHVSMILYEVCFI